MAPQMDADHGVPLLDRAAREHPIAQKAGVVHHHVETAPGVQSRLDQSSRALPVRDVLAVGDRLATHRADALDHLAGRPLGAPLSVGLGPEVVHHHLGALPGELQGVSPADSAAGARHDHDSSFTDLAHDASSGSYFLRITDEPCPKSPWLAVRPALAPST